MFLVLMSLLFSGVSADAENKKIIDVVSEENHKIKIDDSNWKQVLEREWMLAFFIPKCKGCKVAEEAWSKLALKSKELGISIGYVDANSSPSLQARFLVTTFPKAFHIKDGLVRDYKKSFLMEQLETYIRQKQWETDDPIPFWRSPQTFGMTVFSKCYYLAVSMWTYQDELLVKHGIPNWLSYILFTIAFVTIGTIIGLFGVCLTDIIAMTNVLQFPCKKSTKSTSVRNVSMEKPAQEKTENLNTESKKSK